MLLWSLVVSSHSGTLRRVGLTWTVGRRYEPTVRSGTCTASPGLCLRQQVTPIIKCYRYNYARLHLNARAMLALRSHHADYNSTVNSWLEQRTFVTDAPALLAAECLLQPITMQTLLIRKSV